MPIIKSAIKKVRKDKIRTERNRAKKSVIHTLLKKARSEKSLDNLSKAFSALDKAVKTNLIHRNKAARLKSRLTKGVTSEQPTKAAKPKKSARKVSK